ncbi:transcriptional regulator, MarR family [Plantibacter flavus]|uniref:MarR family transcriptional regulator n=1 Tax=Plantibacter flavus TaxID=150123 RepID=A0A1S7B641_9MICO|nr:MULTISPECIES: MarR family transcriptional regulator [Plantibacter]AQX79138.1 MarR family transcriptional regulator [Plantibacter flavus]MBD8465457.1 MarR family transcriptional regulator [Plantibacter sp. CFBP 8798]MDD9151742.1 MarR family transcriptional regulator [Plantibacter flavus]ROR80486.1 MarR family transcriptional regulator [Plantibacter flavus]SMG33938.1 transcriptional regulator, MarR family [Plantibacter flavus]
MTETRWLSDDEQRSWVRFAAVLELLPAALDLQLTRDEHLTHFDYFTLAMLSETPGRTLRTSALAARTNATLPRLSRVLTRLEEAGFVARTPCPEDRRATNVTLTDAGWDKVVQAAPGHVEHVRSLVLDALTPAQIEQLGEISAALLTKLDPDGRMFASEA